MLWTDEQAKLLERLWLDGRSASECAARIGGGLTRNGVIGKVHRLGLHKRARATVPSHTPPARASNPAPKPEVSAAPALLPPSKPAVLAPVALPAPPPLGVSFFKVEDGCCMWPINAAHSPADYLHCGRRKPTPRALYCTEHAIVSAPSAAARKQVEAQRLRLGPPKSSAGRFARG